MGLKIWTDVPASTAAVSELPTVQLDKGEGAVESEAHTRLASALKVIVEDAAAEHMRWCEGFMQWRGNMIASMQQVPIQAEIDYSERLKGIITFLEKFVVPASILAEAGELAFKATLDNMLKGYRSLAGTFDSTNAQMQADNAAAAIAINNIGTQMIKTNQNAFTERVATQNNAAEFSQNLQEKIRKDQEQTSDRHHAQIAQILKS